eukprot:7243713-Pyramimonas_sp.AAC.1
MSVCARFWVAKSVHIHCPLGRPFLGPGAVRRPSWPSQAGVTQAPLPGSGWASPGSSGYCRFRLL